jgi:hypothetical protein
MRGRFALGGSARFALNSGNDDHGRAAGSALGVCSLKTLLTAGKSSATQLSGVMARARSKHRKN